MARLRAAAVCAQIHDNENKNNEATTVTPNGSEFIVIYLTTTTKAEHGRSRINKNANRKHIILFLYLKRP